MLDYDFDLVCIVLGLSLGYSYLTIWVYVGHIDDVMIVYRMTWRWYGYTYVFLEWLVLWVKVKYVVSCLGWLVSLTWCIYDYEYVMYWIRMLKSLRLECINDMWPLMKLRVSYMWNLEPSGKVMNVEVIIHNGVLQSKRMMDLRLIGWNEIILILMKLIMSFL